METEIRIFCTYCGAENPDYAKFCFSCGREFMTTTPVSQGALEITPHYSRCILQLITGLLLLAGAVLDGLQLGLLHVHDTKLVRPLAMTGVALWLLLAAKRSWKTIGLESATDEGFARKRKRVAKAAIVLAVCFLACASLLGWLIGKSRFQLQTLDADLGEYTKLGDEISRARNNAGQTIESFIAMYEAIEQDTSALQRNAARLTAELAQYDSDFPEYHRQTEKSLHNVSVTQRRTFLLQKQIAIAKELKTSDPSERAVLWRGQMMPLLEQEDKLDSQ